ncbi:hypothetical protein Taro_050845 [Colocasia esculenta]|uniref:Uncharacterized protein n=1 Tax=Colocasia esculenta TaxID=4460 RepID=A0A843XF21_COLES|nr:hypothetical protein [Colocasia esculenta]
MLMLKKESLTQGHTPRTCKTQLSAHSGTRALNALSHCC